MAILGFTFKENCPDTRNSKVFDIVEELREYGIEPFICDPVAGYRRSEKISMGVSFSELNQINNMDAVIIAVSHSAFLAIDMSALAKNVRG